MRHGITAAGSIAVAMLLAGCGGGAARTIAVEMRQMAYVPAVLQAHVGDTIVFSNHDLVPHTVTARDRAWDSGSIAPDSSWRMVVDKGGAFYCAFHPTMTGSIKLE